MRGTWPSASGVAARTGLGVFPLPLSPRHPLLSDVGSSSPGRHANHKLSSRGLLRFRNTGPNHPRVQTKEAFVSRPNDFSAAGCRPQYQVWSNRHALGTGREVHPTPQYPGWGTYGIPNFVLTGCARWRRRISVSNLVVKRSCGHDNSVCGLPTLHPFPDGLRGWGLHLPTPVTQRESAEKLRA